VRIKLSIFVILSMMLLMGCSSETEPETETEAEVATESLDTASIKALVNDYTIDKLDAKQASITSTELIIEEDDNQKKVYQLPEEEFFVSIAPFKTETHECDIHSLTGCQGELVSESFDVEITNASGDLVLDESKTTEANGFIDLWLPRNDTYTVVITQDDKTTEAEISTFEGDKTCITTMQLQ